MFALGTRCRTTHFLSKLRIFSTCSSNSRAVTHFLPSRLDYIEYLQDYQPGGLHPTTIGEVFAQGRYRLVHKLGFGGSSTVWLARDQSQAGKLVTLKIMRAELSNKPLDKIPELMVPRKLLEYVQERDYVAGSNIQTIDDHFTEIGPNGTHLCLVSQFAGPSILSMLDCPGRVSGSRRLRKNLAKKAATQLARAVEIMHAAGFVHGDITTSNILFRIIDNIPNWSDSDVYLHFGEPETEEVVTHDRSPPGPHAPLQLVEPITNALLTNSTLLQDDTLLIDFGQSFHIFDPPTDYKPATIPHYQSPEARFEGTIGPPTDVWALACTIFEMRAGFPLFEAFFGGEDEVLKEIVATLGKLPEPWWGAFENRHLWFDEDGTPKDQDHQNALLPAVKSSIKQKLSSIGSRDIPLVYDGSMMELPGTTLDTVELELLVDLLDKMLCFYPQDRIEMSQVVSHPWFTFE